ncbi:PIN domain protein [Leptospira santarosai str. CBC379]|uniref:PIN domain-containing protein n=1 Tax=Leptospira santarosai TaxID=28183 RepID=UPI00029854F8|nr:PIN domain-containing protein [Leptospira santarosai]EKR90312.1 PIN domain protein [Leptospira santarosai str. CBC379]UZN05978.1 PIN domain-containing protein [Leptospira santarosai]
MSRIERVYVDTSVYGGYFDKEFAEWTEKFFEEVDQGKFKLVVSNLIDTELKNAPKHIREFSKTYIDNSEIVLITKNVSKLAKNYIAQKVVGETNFNDCVHIAAASIAKVDLLVSWNFKHIVRLDRIQGYNSVNKTLGYPVLEIRSPMEVLHYE